MPAGSDLSVRIRAYLEKLPPAISGASGHIATLKAANALVIGFALPLEEAMAYLETYNQRCEPPWNRKELEHKLNEAAANKKERVRGWLLDGQAPSPEPNPVKRPAPVVLTEEEKIARATRAVVNSLNGWRAGPADVWEASPVRLFEDYDGDAGVAIGCLSDPEDLINVNFDFRLKSDGRGVDIVGPGVTLSGAEWCEYLSEYPMPFREAGCWWRANPVKSRQGSGKDGSFTDADIARFRYHLFEIDKLSMELQLSFFCKMRVPVAMISDSGGKSLHALVKSFATSLTEFEEEAKYLLDEHFAGHGVDPKNKNPSRYSRLPGVPRVIGARALQPGETAARQQILYLNPNPPERIAIL